MVKEKKSNNCIVFFDFDNTITTFDVLDSIIERYSVNPKWRELEKLWKDGKIGSAECLKGQLGCLRVTKRSLDSYLSGIKIDPYYKKILGLLKRKKIKTVIVSDNFDYILRKILKNNNCGGLSIFSNKVRLKNARLFPDFPLINKACLRCAHCKSGSLKLNSSGSSDIFYVGDGLSDLCPSEKADLVFAKGTLKEHLKKKGIHHIPFDDLKKVYTFLQRRLT